MKYGCIYADCPWSYRNKGGQGVAENHYRTMSNEDIYNLDVASISAKDCILFLWVTFPNLQEGLQTVKSWGFEYKTLGFCWVKRNRKSPSWFFGLGFWTRSNPEICIIATKGKPKRISKAVHCVVDTPIEKHSKKPDIVREKIVELMGDIPRIELFARKKYDGWDCLGNEIDGRDIRDAIETVKNTNHH
ncbi:MAG: MT-A70 family methyltransferase [Oscillospiraceae bacterium]|nr:MT-A70 family methyltransferase [Oscillospiraceae bacterium]